MYIRWKVKRGGTLFQENTGILRSHDVPVADVHAAYIVQSVRVEGKPRQKTIAYLGAYTDGYSGSLTIAARLWRALFIKTQALGLSREDRGKLYTQLHRAFPRPRDSVIRNFPESTDYQVDDRNTRIDGPNWWHYRYSVETPFGMASDDND